MAFLAELLRLVAMMGLRTAASSAPHSMVMGLCVWLVCEVNETYESSSLSHAGRSGTSGAIILSLPSGGNSGGFRHLNNNVRGVVGMDRGEGISCVKCLSRS